MDMLCLVLLQEDTMAEEIVILITVSSPEEGE